ncbi:MAG: arsenite methyltransferase [Candidatus Vogelbacteria bacterium]|nr:arsenite methyltransferase [Candidatus Vogelbacteria bacterium]
MDKNDEVKKIVKNFYGQVATKSSCSCCGTKAQNAQIAKSIGYSDEELKIAGGTNLGLGCGNPTAVAHIKEGDTVIDLGSGAGLDCFLAAQKVGETGRVIGVDMSPEMIALANEAAQKQGYKNLEFRLGDIENLPADDNSIDVAISNCVVNLAPDKLKVFKEVYRVLKTGGRMYLSDIVLLGDLTEEQRSDSNLLAGCVSGALLKDDYLKIITDAGFQVAVLSEDKEISKRQYQGIALESIKIEAKK